MVDKGIHAPSERHPDRPVVDHRDVRRGLLATIGASEPVTVGLVVVQLQEGRGGARCGVRRTGRSSRSFFDVTLGSNV